MPNVEAPNTFRTPISLVRWVAKNAASPKAPRQAMIIAKTEKEVNTFPLRCSA